MTSATRMERVRKATVERPSRSFRRALALDEKSYGPRPPPHRTMPAAEVAARDLLARFPDQPDGWDTTQAMDVGALTPRREGAWSEKSK